MNKDDWIKKLSYADEEYVIDADPFAIRRNRARRKQRSRRALASVACLLLMIAIGAAWLFIPYSTVPPSVNAYAGSEYFDVIEKLNAFTYEKPKYKNNFEMLLDLLSVNQGYLGGDNMDMAPGDSGASMPDNEMAKPYEEVTDNQVEGVIEGDLFKRTSDHIFYLDLSNLHSYAKLRIYSIDGENSSLVKSFDFSPTGLYLTEQTEMYLSNDGETVTVVGNSRHQKQAASLTSVIAIDVSDFDNIKIKDEITISGSLISSRISDGKLLVLSKYGIGSGINFDNPETYIPSYNCGNGEEYVDGDAIVCPEILDNKTYTVAVMINANTLSIMDTTAILSYSDVIFVSENAIYATRRYNDIIEHTSDEDDSGVTKRVRKTYTDVTRIQYTSNSLHIVGTVTVEGFVKDQYSLDEYGDSFRIVTTTNTTLVYDNAWGIMGAPDTSVSNEDPMPSQSSFGTSASIYAFAVDTLKLYDSVENFAPRGDTVRSVRFDGDYAYVCTSYMTTDPVYFFDLSYPKEITYKDTGTIPGFSTSLINLGDGYLLGVGIESWGQFKIEIYVESEDKVESVAKLILNNTEYSDIYKSYYINRNDDLIGLPIYIYSNNEIGYYYILLKFDGNKIYEINRVNIDKSYDYRFSPFRATVVDGYFYVLCNDKLYVEEIGIN